MLLYTAVNASCYAVRASFHLCALFVVCGHGMCMCMAGLLVTLHPCGVFPCLSAFRRRQQWQCMAGFSGDEAPYAVFSIPVVRPKMRDIMAGMDEKDSEAVHPCRGAEAVSHGLDCSADHSCSPVSVHVVVDVPVQCCLCSDRGAVMLQALTSLSWRRCRFSWSSFADHCDSPAVVH